MDKMSYKTIFVEGNKGGDSIDITPMGDNLVRLTIGHCCVYTIYGAVVPVEFITLALSRAIENGIEKTLKESGWPRDYVNELIEQIEIQ